MAERDDNFYENVVFIDEYPELAERCERRRLNVALGQLTLAVNMDPGQLLLFTLPEEGPDGNLPA